MQIMTDTAGSSQKTPSRWRRWIKYALWSCLILIVLCVGLFAIGMYEVYGGTLFRTAELIDTETCGNGDYRLLRYQYDTGDGYLELVNRRGKVMDETSYSRADDFNRVRWSEDCQAVAFDDDTMNLEVPHHWWQRRIFRSR